MDDVCAAYPGARAAVLGTVYKKVDVFGSNERDS
jgi:hypothetical protein